MKRAEIIMESFRTGTDIFYRESNRNCDKIETRGHIFLICTEFSIENLVSVLKISQIFSARFILYLKKL